VSFCGELIRSVQWLERQSQIVANKVCTVQAIEDCADWEDEGYNACVQTADEGYNACSQTADEGYNECCDWWPCSWACDAVVWVSNIVCVAWTWVSNIVCVVWNWISKWVCRIIHWIYTTICKLVISIIFWFIRRVLTWIIFLPCKAHDPDLDPRIKHIFVLVLENRSFDHMFGEIPIKGTDAETRRGTTIERRSDEASNDVLDDNGNLLFHCVVGPGQAKSVGVDPGHEFDNTLMALCGINEAPLYPPYPPIDNSGFAQSFHDKAPDDPCSVMLSYTKRDVPVIAALAEEFAICDHWFSSMPGPTWPNRFFFHAASSAGLDDSPSNVDSALDELLAGVIFDNGTLYDMLDSENIDWSVYEGDHLPQVKALAGMDLGVILTSFHDMDDFEEHLNDGTIANYVFIEPDYGDDITPPADYKCGNSQHPLDDITHGERLVKRVYEAIRSSPVWEQSLLIVTYDEGGGFYDHAAPGPTVSPGDSVTDPVNNHHDFAFDQLGVRVPAIVCSPWIPRNVIDHREYEHASVPATVERLWGLPNMTDRDQHARDLTSLLSLAAPRTDARTSLPDAAPPDAQCDDDETSSTSDALRAREPYGTVLDSMTRSRAREQSPIAITSTAVGFFKVALRQDLLLAASRAERRAIVAQARTFDTMGEVSAYAQRVDARVRAARARAATTGGARQRG
jgi:phospholipase C